MTATLPDSLVLYFDGACEPNPRGTATYGWLLTDDNGSELASGKGVAAPQGDPRATNNFAEYCALGFGLRHLQKSGWSGSLTVCGDSALVVNQLEGKWKCNADNLRTLLARCRKLLAAVGGEYATAWVPREENARADALTRAAYEEATGRPFPERRPSG